MYACLFLFPSKGAALSYPTIAANYDDRAPFHPNAIPDVLVFNRLTGQIDGRWGIFLLLDEVPTIGDFNFDFNADFSVLAADPNIGVILENTPAQGTPVNTIVVENNLGLPVVNFQFLISGSGLYPVWPLIPLIGGDFNYDFNADFSRPSGL